MPLLMHLGLPLLRSRAAFSSSSAPPNNRTSCEVGLLWGAFFCSLPARLEVEARAFRQPLQQNLSLRAQKIDGMQDPEITLSCDESFIKEHRTQKSPQPSLEP